MDFGVSCDEAVRADFDRALALLHHMMYAQAREAFEAIAEADPEWAMAHWGVATTLFQPLRRLRAATEVEGTIEKNPVSPGALLPPNEARGDLLIELDRPAEALAAYRASDEIWPGRYTAASRLYCGYENGDFDPRRSVRGSRAAGGTHGEES